ncbi:hypothetical protein QBC34DRAFT_409672 [Podospora aff. communis PSN243]|uniref:Secreted protein n=1 Tax=Podospora aff. communis PSN243 TaxID=3040156 RepID=A0AAV9GHP5_9PEZI|nr:hypothetical protein QBC34DRAFT_409672 [Podospora aff. communis PSN243]
MVQQRRARRRKWCVCWSALSLAVACPTLDDWRRQCRPQGAKRRMVFCCLVFPPFVATTLPGRPIGASFVLSAFSIEVDGTTALHRRMTHDGAGLDWNTPGA